MTDQLAAWSIARQQREPVDAVRTYKRLLSLGHTMEEIADAEDAYRLEYDEWRELHGELAPGEGV